MEIPKIIPVLGVIVCLCLIFARVTAPEADKKAPLIAGLIIAVIAAFYFVLRPKNVSEVHAEGPLSD